MLAADYPFLDILWTMFIFFLFVIWIWILITVFVDIFRRKDAVGVREGGLDHLRDHPAVPRCPDLSDRQPRRDGRQEHRADAADSNKQTDAYIQSVAGSGGAAAEIEKAKGLLDSGAITQAEFDSLKAKALAAG